MKPGLNLRPGEWVEVKSEREIRATLGEHETLDGLPFMKEMIPFCGTVHKVFRRANKTCVEGVALRKMDDAVFLEENRCDGSAHGGCARGCMIFWKEDWLKRTKKRPETEPEVALALEPVKITGVKEGENFFCQSTQLVDATTPLCWWDARQYFTDIFYNHKSPIEVIKVLGIATYNKIQGWRHGRQFGQILGNQDATPSETLGLQPGEWVEVKTTQEIQKTLDRKGKNRGLEFTLEMTEFCGRKFQVLQRAEHIVLEMTGQLKNLQNTVILKDSVCSGCSLLGCPRANRLLWREIWLKRVPAA